MRKLLLYHTFLSLEDFTASELEAENTSSL